MNFQLFTDGEKLGVGSWKLGVGLIYEFNCILDGKTLCWKLAASSL